MPNKKTLSEETKEKIKSNFFLSFIGLLLITSTICFTAFGAFQLFVALLTPYEATVMDLLYFTSGSVLLFLIGITNILMDIKSQNKTIAKGILHLLKGKLDATNSTTKRRGSFEDTIKNLLSRQPGMSDEDVSGSISVYDMSNPNNPIFQGDFKNADEMNEMRKNLIDKMLNSHKEFKGKKMTKQQMLDTLSVRELKAELKMAVEAEDWLWAASIRDKIAEKEEGKKKGNSGSEKKDNPEM